MYLPSRNDEFEDRMEDMRMENEILKLKIQAETGGVFGGHNDIPPEIENYFLQHIQSFEEAWRNARQVKVFELIGCPDYKMENELEDGQLDEAIKHLTDMLAKKNIIFKGITDHDPRSVYRLITEKLFELEVSDIDLPGMSMHVRYEEFRETNE